MAGNLASAVSRDYRSSARGLLLSQSQCILVCSDVKGAEEERKERLSSKLRKLRALCSSLSLSSLYAED